MVHNELNIGVDYLWKKIISTDDAGKIQNFLHLVKKVCKLKYCKMKQFQEISGKLQHA